MKIDYWPGVYRFQVQQYPVLKKIQEKGLDVLFCMEAGMITAIVKSGVIDVGVHDGPTIESVIKKLEENYG